MVNTLRNSSNEQMGQALFDYLNLNRHKFNEYGQFNATPDEQDFLPRALLVADEFNPPKLPPKEPWLNRTQRHWAKYPEANLLRNPKTDEDLVRERYQERLDHAKKRRKYSKNKCDEHHEAALKRCNKMYWENDFYPEGSYRGCVQRAGELKDHCYDKKRYPEGKMEWANIDMDIVDETPTSDPRVITFDSLDVPVIVPPMVTPRSDMNAWAKAQRLWQPRYEGSIPANDNFPGRRTPTLSPRPRGPLIRATPGMGYIGGMGGGGKPRLYPQYPGDPRVRVKQQY
jgi:hypothetical protein